MGKSIAQVFLHENWQGTKQITHVNTRFDWSRVTDMSLWLNT